MVSSDVRWNGGSSSRWIQPIRNSRSESRKRGMPATILKDSSRCGPCKVHPRERQKIEREREESLRKARARQPPTFESHWPYQVLTHGIPYTTHGSRIHVAYRRVYTGCLINFIILSIYIYISQTMFSMNRFNDIHTACIRSLMAAINNEFHVVAFQRPTISSTFYSIRTIN